jgi:protein ImuB
MFAVLHLADFALHAVLRNEPQSQSQPAALFRGTGKKSVVIATNPPARRAGVELGMSAPQAVARCARLLIRAPSPAAETEAQATLLAVGFTLSPLIEATAPGVCTADLKGIDAGKIDAPAAAAITHLTNLGLPPTVGIAATPLLALLAARNHAPSSRRSTATDSSRAVVRVTDPAAFLSPLPLAVIDPSRELAQILASWGIHTLGALTALPRDEIVRRFGAEGLALWQRAAGGNTRPLHPVAPPQNFVGRMEFEEPVETLEPLLFILRRFLDRLEIELRAAQLVVVELDLTLTLEHGVPQTLRLRLPEPTLEIEILFRALHTHLEALHTEASITGVQLELLPARPLVRQQGLFETGLRDPHGFAETLARVAAIVGSDRIGTPRAPDTHRPDTVQLIAPHAVIPPPGKTPVHPSLGLPLRRFRPPLPARVEFKDGRAAYLWTEQLRGEISTQRGPWPQSGDWWQADQAWARQEWDIELASGGLYRLVQTNEAFFLEGEYD